MRVLINVVLFVLMVAFACGGVYVGVWECLIGGIVDFVDGVKSDPTSVKLIAIGIFKVIFFEIPIVVGFVLAWICGSSIR